MTYKVGDTVVLRDNDYAGPEVAPGTVGTILSHTEKDLWKVEIDGYATGLNFWEHEIVPWVLADEDTPGLMEDHRPLTYFMINDSDEFIGETHSLEEAKEFIEGELRYLKDYGIRVFEVTREIPVRVEVTKRVILDA